MRVKATVTLPKSGLLNPGRLTAALEDALDDAAQKVYSDLQRPTSTWKTSVAFQIRRIANGRTIGRTISTANEIYGYVNSGTRPHVIRAKNAKYLNFGPSSPKTTPGNLDSTSGSRGPRTTFVAQVNHPGTDPRNYDKVAAEHAEQTFPTLVRLAVKEGTR